MTKINLTVDGVTDVAHKVHGQVGAGWELPLVNDQVYGAVIALPNRSVP